MLTKNHKMIHWIVVLLSSATFCLGMNEFYSSTDHMMQLIDIKRDFSQGLQDFVAALENQTDLLKRALQGLEGLSDDSSEDPEKLISNPITAYKLVRQLQKVGLALEEVAKRDVSVDLSALMSKADLLPSNSDVDGIAMAIIRLQELYKLDPKTMAGLQRSSSLDPDETFYIAEVAHQNQMFHYAVVWLQETLRKLAEGSGAIVTKQKVLNLLSSVPVQTGDLSNVHELSQQLLSHDLLDLKTVLQLANANGLTENIKDLGGLERSLSAFDMSTLSRPWLSTYEALCRGEGINMDPKRKRKLVCRYTRGRGNAHLMYAPAKEEEEWDQPLILRYHDLMTTSEMEAIKGLSRPKLNRAKVSDPVTGQKIPTMVRISKSAWLSEDDSPVVARVNQKIADVTGLDMETAEDLQIANYGIGGQYEPHYDSRVSNDTYFQQYGGRIATVLVYMTDVEVGGATVFPNVGAALQPKKGSAVVWFNLLKNGEEDPRTLHAGCPVFIGNKWVANKWIHIRGQEFRRKCSLSRTA